MDFGCYHIHRLCGGRYRNGSWLRRTSDGWASDCLGLIVWKDKH